MTNEFLKKIDCMVGHYGLFCTPENTEDTMVHVDGRKSLTSELEVLEARFSYYDILGSNGEIEWFLLPTMKTAIYILPMQMK